MWAAEKKANTLSARGIDKNPAGGCQSGDRRHSARVRDLSLHNTLLLINIFVIPTSAV